MPQTSTKAETSRPQLLYGLCTWRQEPHRSIRSRGEGLASDECQEVRIDHVGMGGHQAVREACIDLERAMLEQFRLQQ